MEIVEKIIKSPFEPKQTNVGWFDTSENELKFFINGRWTPSDDKVEVATKAIGDEDGVNIKSDYAKKSEVDLKIDSPSVPGVTGQVLQLDSNGDPEWVTPSAGTTPDSQMSDDSTNAVQNKVIKEYIDTETGYIEGMIPSDASDTNQLVTESTMQESANGKIDKDPNAADGEIPVYNPDIQGGLKPSGVNIDELAKKDGYYGSLTAGAAENLVGNKSVSASFLDRTTAGSADVGTGAAMLTSIKGNSIVWNQLARVMSTYSANGINVTTGPNGYIKINGTATASFFIRLSSDFTALRGHTCMVGSSKALPEGASWSGNYNPDRRGQYILALSDTFDGTLSLRIESGVSFNNDEYYYQVYDLTRMFGAGHEPTTVAEFEALFPLDYYVANAGTILPFAAQALKTTGFNQYNHTTGTAKLLAGNEYQVSGTYTELTIDDEAVTLDSNGCFTPAKNCTLVVTGGNSSDTCVHLTWSGTRNGEYEPYEEHNLTIDPATILDTNGDLIFPYGGMHGAGTAFDEMKPEADGYFHYGTRRFGKVDLGDLDWVRQSSGFESRNFATAYGVAINSAKRYKCSRYNVYADGAGATGIQNADKVCVINIVTTSGYFNKNALIVMDSSYTDAASFKAAMSGVMLIYELATPVTKELATPIPASFYENDWGTESWTPANGETPYTAPCNVEIKYPVNAVDAIRNIPRYFKAPFDVLLTAFQTAGIIASYTLTYDESTQTYECSVTKPTEESASNTNIETT